MNFWMVLAFAFLPLSTFAAEPSADIATYEVPVGGALAPFARYELPFRYERLPHGRVRVSYELPALLLGEAQPVVFEGRREGGSRLRLKNERGEIECARESEETRVCFVRQDGMPVNLPALERLLADSGAGPEERAARLEIASSLARAGGDLVGVLRYRR